MNIKINVSLCRVCLKQGPGTNIYTGNILEKFLFTTLVQVKKNDGLSEIICKRCLARLQIAHDFKKEAIASNTELQSFISDVNKKFQQVTSTTGGSRVQKKRTRKESQQDGSESYDELDEDMQALIYDEQEADDYSEIDEDLSDDNKQAIDRERLVEILGDNSAITIRKTRMRTIQEESQDAPPESMEVFLVDENNDVESDYVVDEYDQNTSAIVSDELDEPQFLEEEDNDDELYEIASDTQTKKGTKSKGSSNPENCCEVCNKIFSTRTNLTRHKITHEGRKPYVCSVCGNSFTQNGSLRSHMFIHTGERPYKCKECGKAFTQSKSLVFHMRRHTGEKPFPCDYCGIRFRQKDGLKRHIIAKHAPDRTKEHVCFVCNKNLLSKYSLNMHLSRHSEQAKATATNKRNKSGDSSQVSTSEDAMKEEYEKRDTADEFEELYECEFCDSVFSTQVDLISHRDTHSELNEETGKYIEETES